MYVKVKAIELLEKNTGEERFQEWFFKEDQKPLHRKENGKRSLHQD